MDLTKHFALFVAALEFLAEPAARRAVASGSSGPAFLDADALQRLADVMASFLAAADLQGRAAIRALQTALLRRIARSSVAIDESRQRLREDAVRPSPPERAISYFQQLVPSLGVDPGRFGQDMRRRAFTLAAATDQQLLKRVQGLISDRLQAGNAFTAAPADIKDLLDQAGITPRNSQYAEMVFRTNVRDAQVQAATDELQDPDMLDAFPVWEYVHATGVKDGNSRPEHVERHGKLYPSTAPFVQVRGTDVAELANCRCNFLPRDKFWWNKAKAGGRRIADGYADVPTIDEIKRAREVERPLRPEPETPEFTGPPAASAGPVPQEEPSPANEGAYWDREARREGFRAVDMRRYAREIRKVYNDTADLINDVIKDAREKYKHLTGKPLTRNMPAFQSGDYNEIKYFDGIARDLAGRYPEILGDHGYHGDRAYNPNEMDAMQRLYDLLAAGPQQRMRMADSYRAAIERMIAERSNQRPGSNDEVPF